MKALSAVLFAAILIFAIFAGCSEDEPGLPEVISTPSATEGADTVFVGPPPETFTSGNAVSSQGHAIQYRFDFDAEGSHDYSPWNASSSTSKGWSDPGSYIVKAQARCAKHSDKVSPWSGGKSVAVLSAVSTPSQPTGPGSLGALETATYLVGGATSIDGHPVEYRLDFDSGGAGDLTDWRAPDVNDLASWSHSWSAPASYIVTAQARSATHPDKVSLWSDGLTVTVGTRFISRPDKPIGPTVPPPPMVGGIGDESIYCTGGATSTDGHPLEYQFSFVLVGTRLGSRVEAASRYKETEWSSEPCAVNSVTYVDSVWTGTWKVRARARSAVETDKLSSWSEGLEVTPGLSGDLPEMRFATISTRIESGSYTTITRPYTPGVPDTVGMFRPFSITYHGITTNGVPEAYLFFPRTSGVELEGQKRWTVDLSDTVRYFPNNDDVILPNSQSFESGAFILAARCFDTAGFQSKVTAPLFLEGACEVIVNFDPDTEIFQLENTYFVGGQEFKEYIDFADGIPDTVPYNSWIRLDYRGWDSPHDSSLCVDVVNECIGYQVQYTRHSDRLPGPGTTIQWLPGEPEDNNPFGTTDSTSMNVGTSEYVLRARAVDEHGRPDGKPFEVPIVGNFSPTLDSYELVNHTGDVISEGGTIVWDWWNPSNYHGNPLDTLDIEGTEVYVVKTFYFNIRATGHDHPKEPSGSGVKDWFYVFTRTDNQSPQDIGRSDEWVEGPVVNVLDDRAEFTFRYSLMDDPGGQSIFDSPPEYWNTELEYSVHGRDIGANEEYVQFIFLNGTKTMINSYAAAPVSRWTKTKGFRFHLRVDR